MSDRPSAFWSLIKLIEERLDRATHHQRRAEDLERKVHESQQEVARAEEAYRRAKDRQDKLWFGSLLAQAEARWQESIRNRANAKRPRRKRGRTPNNELRLRGLGCVLNDYPGTTSESLCDRLDADGHLTYDDDDIELRLNAGFVVIRDLATDKTVRTPVSQLRKYLRDARNA